MRIVLVAPPWLPVPPPGYGGTEAVIDRLATGFAAAGHDVLLCATGDSTCSVPLACTLPRAVGTARMTPALEVQHVVRAYDAIERWDPDIIHDHTLVGPIYAERLDVPVLATNHGPFDSELGELYRAVSDRAGIIAISQDQASKSSGVRIAGVIHHGIDIESIPFGRGKGGYAAFLGRMCPDKGVDVAARIARASGVPLRIAAKLAEPEERQYFEHAVRPLLGRDVEFVGEVGGADKHELLGEASCLLNPLQWDEPFGLVMAEALACGTPVVATPRGSVPEIVDDGRTGFIRTEEDLGAALHFVPELDRRACRDDARRRFATSRMVADHIALFERTLEAWQPRTLLAAAG